MIKALPRTVWHHLLKRRRLTLGLAGALLVTALLVTVYAVIQGNQPPRLIQAGAEAESQGPNTTQATLVSGSSAVTLLGNVLSNQTANIYPRRNGIVEDVYVDIGDTVTKGQIVALLLPKGVEGQSAALIAEKGARKAQADTDLLTAKQVADETIITTQQKINEQETELMIAEREQATILQKFYESAADIDQMQEQAFTAAQNSRQIIEWILLGSNSRSGIEIQDYDLLRNLGLNEGNSGSRYEATYWFNNLYRTEQTYSEGTDLQQSNTIDQLLDDTLNTLSVTNTLLQSTPSEQSANGYDRLSHTQLTDRLNQVIAAQDTIYRAKEKLEDARNRFSTLTASEPELYGAYRSGTLTEAKSNQVRLLEEKIRTAYNSLELTQANQEQIVASKESLVGVAAAALQSEYANSGHRQIRSPFDGVVSKRFLDVGQIVMPSNAAFELTNVPTSLAKKAKTEVQFGLPESLMTALEVGDTINFFLQTDETKLYNATVTRKSPQVDMQTHTVTVQAKVPDELALPHQASVRISLTNQKEPIWRLPSTAIKRDATGQNYVWLMNTESNTPYKQLIAVIAEDGEFAEFTGGITSESKIMLDPPDFWVKEEAL